MFNKIMEAMNNKTYSCFECGQIFTKKSNLYRHKRTAHSTKRHECMICKIQFNRQDNFLRHMKKHEAFQTGSGSSILEKNNDATPQPMGDACSSQALDGTMRTHTIEAIGLSKFDPMMFLKNKYEEVKDVIKRTIKERGGIKWYLSIKIKMSRRKGDEVETADPHFRGKCQTCLKFEDVDEGLKESIKKIYTSFIEYQRQGSNWTVEKVVDLTIHMARYRPLKGSSYIPLPIKLRSKHAIINVKNKDKKCFMWYVLAALHPCHQHSERISQYYDHKNSLNFDEISFPVKMEDIPKFEKQNDISINVFGYEKGDVFPIHITKNRYEKLVNLLVISDDKKSHYCWIKDLNRLLFDQKSNGHRHFYCKYCLHGFTKERLLKDHESYCQTHAPQKIELPTEEDKWLFYKDIRKQLKVPYVIYADFESLLQPVQGCETDPEKSSTTKTTKHLPCGFSYKVVGLTPETSKEPVIYRGIDAADKFVECMVDEMDYIEGKFKHCEPMVMTGKDWQNFKKATKCHICMKELGEDRVRDHNHQTGTFTGE